MPYIRFRFLADDRRALASLPEGPRSDTGRPIQDPDGGWTRLVTLAATGTGRPLREPDEGWRIRQS